MRTKDFGWLVIAIIAGLMLVGCAGTPKKDMGGVALSKSSQKEMALEKATLERVSKITEDLVGRLTASLPPDGPDGRMKVTLGNFPQTGLFGRMLRNRLATTGRLDVVVKEDDTLRLISRVSRPLIQDEEIDAVVDVNILPLAHHYYVEAFIVDTRKHRLLSSVEMVLDKLGDPYITQSIEGFRRTNREDFRRYRYFSTYPLLISR
ncbi:MAG: hypothetical protein HYY20_06305 [Candidatus Tectomicrobia bacterium]|uniref:Uncharacterized protein n=1 Tax=Tectimicrobiota bacterium TaxID=2528274 RepID=A0A932CN64_UNCTE|nr:hypothetical protein [Candidatus Tectomicrobia bacterium]